MIITTKNGKKILVDDDFSIPEGWSIHVTSHGYASMIKATGVRTEKGWYKYKRKYLHRYIMNSPEGKQVDHINGDRLDNRRGNLRICTNQENNFNKPSINGLYKGVYQSKETGSWIAQITFNGKCKSLGSYDNPHDAAHAYNTASKEMHGEYGYQNEIKEELKGDSARRGSIKPSHGTHKMYSEGCRCFLCIEMHKLSHLSNIERTKARSKLINSLKPPIIREKDKHGTVAGYKHGKCRCDDCRNAYSAYQKRFTMK